MSDQNDRQNFQVLLRLKRNHEKYNAKLQTIYFKPILFVAIDRRENVKESTVFRVSHFYSIKRQLAKAKYVKKWSLFVCGVVLDNICSSVRNVYENGVIDKVGDKTIRRMEILCCRPIAITIAMTMTATAIERKIQSYSRNWQRMPAYNCIFIGHFAGVLFDSSLLVLFVQFISALTMV